MLAGTAVGQGQAAQPTTARTSPAVEGLQAADAVGTPEEPPSTSGAQVADNSTAIPGVGEAAGTETNTVQPQEEPVVPSVWVYRSAQVQDDGNVVVVHALDVDESQRTDVTGLVLSEVVPPGWSVVSSQPAFTTVDSRTRVAKWLLMPGQVQDGTLTYTAAPDSENSATEDWTLAQSWYTYRRPSDGRSLSFSTVPR